MKARQVGGPGSGPSLTVQQQSTTPWAVNGGDATANAAGRPPDGHDGSTALAGHRQGPPDQGFHHATPSHRLCGLKRRDDRTMIDLPGASVNPVERQP
jgi:hypothetical protein